MAITPMAKKCDLCDHEFEDGQFAYDAKITNGPWATMCHICWKQQTGQQLGTGLGQRFRVEVSEQGTVTWTKVAG